MLKVEINSAPRKCGSLKRDSYYAGGQITAGGMMNPWVWLLAEPWDIDLGTGEDILQNTLWYSVPPRAPIEVNPRETFRRNAVWLAEWPSEDGDDYLNIHNFGLADHVGQMYTPWTMYEETEDRGPNRKISGKNARRWAGEIPFHILFSHSHIPVFPNIEHAFKFLQYCASRQFCSCFPQYSDPKTWRPTWELDGFGPRGGNLDGRFHPMVQVLKALEALKWKLRGFSDMGIRVEYREAVYGMSWLNYIAYTGDLSEEDEAAYISEGEIV